MGLQCPWSNLERSDRGKNDISSSPNPHQCLWICLQVRRSKRLGCHADLCTVSRCRTRGESGEYCAGKKVCKHTFKKVCKREIHPGFETWGRRHQKSKTVISVAPQKDLCPRKKLIKRKKNYISLMSVLR